MAADVAAFRTRFNLSPQTPAPTIQAHLEAAGRRLARDSGLSTAPEGLEAEWEDALLWAALKSVQPFLNLFSLDAVAPVMNMVQNAQTTIRFCTPDELEALAQSAEGEYQRLLAVINPGKTGESIVRLPGLSMVAINGS